MNSAPALKTWKAIMVGWLVVNVPVITIVLVAILIGFAVRPKIWWLFFSVGLILGWAWWSQAVPRWRRWSHRRGANPERLQKWAVITGLVWPKGSVFEKTEARLDDE